MDDSNNQEPAKTVLPTVRTDPSSLRPTTPGASPPTTSPSSLAPPDGSPASALSRPVSPSVRDSRTFHPQPSTQENPETPSPKSLRDVECPRTGLWISTSQGWLDEGVPVGVPLHAHKPYVPSTATGTGSHEIQINEPTPEDPAQKLGQVVSKITSGPTILVGEKPCMLTTSPMPEDVWRDSAMAIVHKYNKMTKIPSPQNPKMQDQNGRYLTPLRRNQVRSRASSVVSAVKSVLSTPTLGIQPTTDHGVKAGRVWLCNLGCEGATGRKRDWALVELDPNVAGTAERRNVVNIGGESIALKPPKKTGAKPGRRIVIATLSSRNIPVRGVTGEREQCVFGYQTVQKIVLDRDAVLHDGDAGACVVDEETGQFYGILVMQGMMKKEVEERKKNGEKGINTQSVAWFVPLDRIIEDICITYPLNEISFGH